MVRKRRATILIQTAGLSICLLLSISFWAVSQVKYQILQQREYQFWYNQYQAVHYIRTQKKITIDKRLFVLPRVVSIYNGYYSVKVTELHTVQVPQKNK